VAEIEISSGARDMQNAQINTWPLSRGGVQCDLPAANCAERGEQAVPYVVVGDTDCLELSSTEDGLVIGDIAKGATVVISIPVYGVHQSDNEPARSLSAWPCAPS